MRKTAILVAILVSASAGAEAKTLYVDAANGTDSRTYAGNSSSAPWASIGRAAWGSSNRNSPNSAEAARAGDTVIVRAGIYSTAGTDVRYLPAYNPVNSGTASQPIVFDADGTVILRLSSSRGPVIGASSRNYITWRGFTINEAQAPSRADTGPVILWDTVGSIIEDCIIDGNGDPGHGDNHPGIRLEEASRVTVRNNRISNFRTSVVNQANGAGIQVYFSGDAVFEHNEIYDSGSGIFLKAPADDNHRTQVDQFTIRYNKLVRNRLGIAIHRSPNTAARPTRIYQNIVTDALIGIRIWPFDNATGPMNAKIVNNTLHNNAESLTVSGDLSPNAGHLFWNNIVTSSGTFAINYAGSVSNFTQSNLNVQHNAYWTFNRFGIVYSSEYSSLANWKTATGQDSAGPASVNLNPLYANAAQGDFRLQAGSPVRTGAVDILDLDGDGSTSDIIGMGAYVIGNEVIGITTGGEVSGAPSAPTGLRIVAP